MLTRKLLSYRSITTHSSNTTQGSKSTAQAAAGAVGLGALAAVVTAPTDQETVNAVIEDHRKKELLGMKH